MIPCLRPGGRVRIECSGADRARPGDIIVFRDSDQLVAHRLVFRLGLGRYGYLYQRGDAEGTGSWVRERQVVGLVTVSTDADGVLLYERGSRAADRWSILAFVVRAVLAHARSALRSLLDGGRSRGGTA